MTHSPPPVPGRAVPPGQLSWLEGELRTWEGEGLLDPAAAEVIRARYVAVRRFSLVRLLLVLGAAFVGVGLIWVVATNLDRLAPLARFLLVAAIWLSLLVGSEVLAARRGIGDERRSPALGAARLLAALAFGAVVFQAAQSLQVPAYEPRLLGVWGLGALVQAYAVRGLMPLLLGIGVASGWYVWQVAESADSALGFVAAVLTGGVVISALALLHRSSWLRGAGLPRSFEVAWREAGALLVLVGLFAAALPHLDAHGFRWSASLVAGLALGAVSMAAAVAGVDDRWSRLELLVPVVALVIGSGLVLWDAGIEDVRYLSGAAYAKVVVGVLVYLATAAWFAVLGVLRDSTRLTVIAALALVVFTTVQAFAVFAPIVSGATLFLVVGAVLVVSGFTVDRGRRQLTRAVEAGAP
jgi:uncharacterized membrane protein